MADLEKLEKGDRVRLVSLPDGYVSKDLPLTLGEVYEFRYYMGSCVCISTDHEGLDGHIWAGRVEKVNS